MPLIFRLDGKEFPSSDGLGPNDVFQLDGPLFRDVLKEMFPAPCLGPKAAPGLQGGSVRVCVCAAPLFAGPLLFGQIPLPSPLSLLSLPPPKFCLIPALNKGG